MLTLYVAPLCPAGHLLRKGGDWLSLTVSPITSVGDWRNQIGRPISPLAREMSGRTEGGAVGRKHPNSIVPLRGATP
jgi:hypothetical protein